MALSRSVNHRNTEKNLIACFITETTKHGVNTYSTTEMKPHFKQRLKNMCNFLINLTDFNIFFWLLCLTAFQFPTAIMIN